MNNKQYQFVVQDELESTNNYAKQLVSDKAGDRTVVLAHYQSGGRGQQGNSWESEAGKNLLFSVILYPGFMEAELQFYISMAVSLALVDVLDHETDGVCIKWPNDIYVGKRKIAGILIENFIKGSKLECAIVGVGLNLNQEVFRSNAPNPVSLKQLSGKTYSIEAVLQRFLDTLDSLLAVLAAGRFGAVKASYLQRLLGRNEWRSYCAGGAAFEAKIVGIGEYGKLQLETRQGDTKEFMFKEVEFVF